MVFKKLATVRISKTIKPTENLQQRLYNILFRDLEHIYITMDYELNLNTSLLEGLLCRPNRLGAATT